MNGVLKLVFLSLLEPIGWRNREEELKLSECQVQEFKASQSRTAKKNPVLERETETDRDREGKGGLRILYSLVWDPGFPSHF